MSISTKKEVIAELEALGYTEALDNDKELKTYDITSTFLELKALLAGDETPTEEVLPSVIEEEVKVTVMQDDAMTEFVLLSAIKRNGVVLQAGEKIKIPNNEEAKKLVEMKVIDFA